MNTKSKLQLLLSADLLEAINLAAAKDMRTQRAFVTKILQEHPSVRGYLTKVDCVATTKEVISHPSPEARESPEAFFARLTPEQKAKRAAAGLPTELPGPTITN